MQDTNAIPSWAVKTTASVALSTTDVIALSTDVIADLQTSAIAAMLATDQIAVLTTADATVLTAALPVALPVPEVGAPIEPEVPAAAIADPDAGTVIVTVPKAFNLCLDSNTIMTLRGGVQRVTTEVAEHWYSKANGMQVFEG